MHKISITKTAPHTKRYPLHQHNYWEVMYYLEGSGYLATDEEPIPFSKGSILIVPPNVMHGSVSEEGFINIAIGCDFDNLFMFGDIVTACDNAEFDGEKLAMLIYKNQHANTNYLSALCSAYALFILQNLTCEKNINKAIGKIINTVYENFFDANFDITVRLNQSGYVEDYVRSEFKKQTGETPIDFLAKTRITHAKKLMEIYGNELSVSEIAAACGFNDPVYFSRRFKQLVGTSPSQYRKTVKERFD